MNIVNSKLLFPHSPDQKAKTHHPVNNNRKMSFLNRNRLVLLKKNIEHFNMIVSDTI